MKPRRLARLVTLSSSSGSWTGVESIVQGYRVTQNSSVARSPGSRAVDPRAPRSPCRSVRARGARSPRVNRTPRPARHGACAAPASRARNAGWAGRDALRRRAAARPLRPSRGSARAYGRSSNDDRAGANARPNRMPRSRPDPSTQRGAEIASKWALIPDDVQVLITHGPPHGILDEVVSPRGKDQGCEALRERIVSLPALRLHAFGHIHEAYGTFSEGGRRFVNASICDYLYAPVNAPVVVDL